MPGSSRQPDWDGRESCRANRRRVLPDLLMQMVAVWRQTCQDAATPRDLHRLRLNSKRLRYTVELFREPHLPGLVRVLKKLKAVQRSLGEISDCDTTATLLRSQGLADSEDGAALVATLEARRDERIRAFLDAWQEAIASPEFGESWAAALRRGDGPNAPCAVPAATGSGSADRIQEQVEEGGGIQPVGYSDS